MTKLDGLVHAIEGSAGVDKLAGPLQKVAEAIPLKVRREALSGTWLGHPLHPVLTDVPIGAWTSAVALDLLGGEETEKAAERLIGLGVLAALPTAASGAADWVDTWGGTKRIGSTHAAVNVVGVVGFALSYVARRRGRQGLGQALALLGAAAATVGAWLGGHLSYRKAVGVDNTAFDEGPQDWVAVAQADVLAEGKPVSARAGGVEVLLYRNGGSVYALSNKCSHRGCPLHEGSFEGGNVTCACHGSAFRLEDGSVVSGPAVAPQPSYDVRVKGGAVEVRARPSA